MADQAKGKGIAPKRASNPADPGQSSRPLLPIRTLLEDKEDGKDYSEVIEFLKQNIKSHDRDSVSAIKNISSTLASLTNSSNAAAIGKTSYSPRFDPFSGTMDLDSPPHPPRKEPHLGPAVDNIATSNLDPPIDTGSKEGFKDTITSSIVKELSKKAYTIPDDRISNFLENPDISNTYSDSNQAVLLMLLRNSLSSSPRAAISWIYIPSKAFKLLVRQYSRPIESKKEDVYNEFHALTFSTYKKGLSAFNAEFNGYLAKLTMAKIDIDPSLILNQQARMLGLTASSLNIEYLMADILEESRNPAIEAYRVAHIANSSNSTPNSNSNPSKKGKNKKKGKKKASYNVEGQNYSAKSAEQASFILGSYNLAIEEEEESDSSSNSRYKKHKDFKGKGLKTSSNNKAKYKDNKPRRRPRDPALYNSWLYDTGSTDHISNSKERFTTFTPNIGQLRPINTGNGPVSPAGIGSIILEVLSRKAPPTYTKLVLDNVLYLPNININIVSGRNKIVVEIPFNSIRKEDYRPIIEDAIVSEAIEPNKRYKLRNSPAKGTTLEGVGPSLRGKRPRRPTREPKPLTGTGDLPRVLRELVIEGNKVVEKAISSPTLKEPNIGHIGLRLLKKTSSITKGLPNFDKIKEADFHCSSCDRGKAVRRVSKALIPDLPRVLDSIEGDTVKIRPRPYNRNPIVLLLVDRKSRYRWVFNLPNKSGPIVANAIKGFFRGLRNGFGRYPTKFHFDGGTEITDLLTTWLAKRGIKFSTSAPYIHEQNGLVERSVRVILDLELVNSTAITNKETTPFQALFDELEPEGELVDLDLDLEGAVSPDPSNLNTEKPISIEIGPSKLEPYESSSDSELDEPSPDKPINPVIVESTRPTISIRKPELPEVFPQTIEPIFAPKPIEVIAPNQPITNEPLDNSDLISEGDKMQLDYYKLLAKTSSYILSFIYKARKRVISKDSTPTTYKQVLKLPRDERSKWLEAITKEFIQLLELGVFKFLPRSLLPSNRKLITCRNVLKVKKDAKNRPIKYKSRLVARGFIQVEGLDYTVTYASTSIPPTWRILLAIGAVLDWEIEQADFIGAFLNSALREEIYIEIPEGLLDLAASNKAIYKLLLKYGYNPSTPNIIKLSKALYGLKQSPREWQDKLKILLKSLGYLPLISDPGVFYNAKTCHFIVTYIDDCLFIGPNIGYITDLKKRLNKVYTIEDLGPAAYFLGVQIIRDRPNRRLWLNQSQYLSRSLNRPTKSHLNAAKNLFKYLNSTKDYSICFSYNGNTVADLGPKLSNSSNTTTKLSRDFHSKEGPRPLTTTSTTIVDSRNSKGSSRTSIINSSLVPIGFSDSDFAGDKATSKSTYGYLYKLASGPISWKTKRATTIALSTLEAETDGLTEAICEVQWIIGLFSELHRPIDYPITLYRDNQGSITVANDPALHARTKHTLLKFRYVREQVKAKIVTIIYLNTKLAVKGLTVYNRVIEEGLLEEAKKQYPIAGYRAKKPLPALGHPAATTAAKLTTPA
ncbi:hypothetical protein P8C59_005187 [Phyllachora maydis]|uniref:Integrase catalytic domain-containing protein n=1 Tax=Phyllachora maydis TaxID=1825666 RepID=A0AAD9MBZ6_9PEZI|nr:hypothetical protein P8C59_005187 [Phyllachora maydis]